MVNPLVDFMNRVRRAGGFNRFFSNWVRYHFKPFWMLLQRIPILKDILNKFYISSSLAAFERTVPRIPRYTLTHNYPTMDVLYDESRTTYQRLLPRAEKYTAELPDIDLVASLFKRDTFTPESNRKITVLIAHYAQWFTHQFLNTNPDDPNKAGQPLGINLSQLYGSLPEVEKSVRAYEGGLLKSTFVGKNEFPEILDVPSGSSMGGKRMFNMPIPLANMVPGFAAIHVLFFRRHQYVARQLAEWASKNGKEMSDEEIFQKTKMILAITVLKITMHDYVARSLQSSHVKIRFDQTVKRSLMWKWFGPSYYPPCNAIQIEFNFLYRWHQFIPDTMKIVKTLPDLNGQSHGSMYDVDSYDCDEISFPKPGTALGDEWNSVAQLVDKDDGLERVLFSSAAQRAGKLELNNTHEWLVNHVVIPGIKKNREYQLASYNDYREYFGFGRVQNFEQITSNKKLQRQLKKVYGHVDNIEYYPGVFAEDKDFGGIHGPFLATIGVAMTFAAIHASRLFEFDVVNEESLTPRGLELIDEINYIEDLTKRHTGLGDARMRFTLPDDYEPAKPSTVIEFEAAQSIGRSHIHQE